MSSFELRHPESDLLLPYLDGELPAGDTRRVRRHVESCWQCRAELDELKSMVADCVRYRKNLADAVPPPPQPWPDLTREFSRIDDSLAPAPLFRRPAFRWVLVAAGAASLVAATFTLRNAGFLLTPERSETSQRPPVQKKELPQSSPVSTTTRTDGLPPSVPGRAAPREKPVPALASAADELEAVAALRRLGADLGEPVEVAREGPYVVVSGVGVSPALQRDIREALASAPHVVVRFTEASPTPAIAAPASAASGPTTGTANATGRLEAQLGGRAQLESFSAQLLDHNEAVMARVYALRRLAQQFPSETERQLSRENQRLLTDLASQHLSALARETTALDSSASPVLVSLGAAGQPPRILNAASWQAAAEEVFVSARQVDILLAALLGVAAPDRDSAQSGPTGNLPQQAFTALAQLQADVQQCERLLKN